MSKPNSRHYDFIVIGAGLSGLAVARRLSLEGARVLLLEGQDFAGGTHRSVENAGTTLTNGLRLIPDLPASQDALAFLAGLLPGNLSVSQIESSPLTYDSGQLKPFVGFGDNPPAFLHQISGYLSQNRLVTQPEPWAWCSLLAENPQFEIMTRSYVTRFHLNEEKVTGVTVNGQKEYSADQFVFAGSVGMLKSMFPAEIWTAKIKSKFSRLKLWTQVGLDLIHKAPFYEGSHVLLLDGTTKDDLGPCIGVVNTTAGVTSSQWMTFLEDEEAEDSEILGHSLKKIRRQIKRAFHEAADDLIFERICVFPSISATLPPGGFLPEFENLHYANGQLNANQGLVGSLLQARTVLAQLGFSHPVEQHEEELRTDVAPAATTSEVPFEENSPGLL